MVSVEFDTETVPGYDEYRGIIEAVIVEAARQFGLKCDGEVGVTFVTADEIRDLNCEHRDVDNFTDVLSFPMFDDFDEINAGHPILLGDIVICPEVAVSQAKDYGHSLKRELCFLAAHGMLHLLGYDHETEDEEARMVKAQEDVLSALGITRN